MATADTPAGNLIEDDLIGELQGGRAVAVVGAGVSMLATGGNQLASWRGLLLSGIDRCVVVTGAKERWAQLQRAQLELDDVDCWLAVAELIQTKLARVAGEFGRWLDETVGELQAVKPEVVQALQKLDVPIITTNYDGILEQVSGLKAYTWRQPQLVEHVLRGTKPGIIHIHGYYEDPESVVLGIESYENVLRDKHSRAILRGLRTMNTLLFVGFGKGLKDPNFDALLRWSRDAFRDSPFRHFRLALNKDVKEVAQEHDPADSIHVLDYGTEYGDLANYLLELANKSARTAKDKAGGKTKAETSRTAAELGDVSPEYLQNLRENHGFIRFLEMPDTQEKDDVPIDQLFVRPRLSPQPIDPDTLPENWPALTELVERLSEHSHLVVLGDPGSGKSTLVSWITWQLCDPEAAANSPLVQAIGPRVPIPLVLRELGLSTDLTWEKLLAAVIQHRIGQHLGNRQNVEEILRSGNALMLLDGLDEIGNPTIRKKLRNAVHAAMSEYQDTRWVLTSRRVGYDEVPFHLEEEREKPTVLDRRLGLDETNPMSAAPLDRSMTRRAELLYLAPFDDAQIEQFTLNWYKRHETDRAAIPTKVNDFVSAVKQKRDTLRLARIAYLLTLMVLIHRKHTRLPDGRNELYRRIADAYLDSIEQYRNLGDTTYSPEQKKRWLAEIGYLMQLQRAVAEGKRGRQGRQEIFQRAETERTRAHDAQHEILVTDKQLAAWMTSLLRSSGIEDAEQEADRLIDHFSERSGLLVPRGAGKFAFMHLSMQEYFAACFLFEECLATRKFATDDDQCIAEPPSDDQLRRWANVVSWREVYVMLFEMLSNRPATESDRFLEHLFYDRLENDHPREESRAARLLAELVTNTRVGLSAEKKAAARRICWIWELTTQQACFERSYTVQQAALPSLLAEHNGDLKKAWHASAVEPDSRWRYLNLSGCSGLTDLAPLASCRGLSTLCLTGCTGLTGLDGLSGLGSLEELDLSGCTGLTDLAGLAGLGSLQQLSLSGCTRLTDLAGLAGLGSLGKLSLAGCTGLTELAGLAGLGSLHELSLTGCTGLTELAGLAGLGSLRTLYLYGCTGLTDLAGLAGLDSLQWLNIAGCSGLTDLAGLAGLGSLGWLYVTGCTGLTDLAGLASLGSLGTLNLSGCTGLTDLAGLAGLGSLGTLNLSGCTGLTDLYGLADLGSLQELNLTGCTALTGLAPLSGLGSLRTLYLFACISLTDLAPLSDLGSLRTLYLFGCTSLTDLAPLARLKNLRELHLPGGEHESLPDDLKLRKNLRITGHVAI